MGAGLIGNAGGMMSGLMSHRKPAVTEVWALPGQKPKTRLQPPRHSKWISTTSRASIPTSMSPSS